MKRLLILLLALLLFPLAAGAEIFKDADNAFSIDIPVGWTALSPQDVRTATSLVSPDPNLHCFAGFEHSDSGLLLISASPYPESKTYTTFSPLQIRQLAAELTGASPAEFHAATQPVVANIGAGAIRQITWFSTPPGFVVDYQQLKENTRSHSIAYLGRDRAVLLHFFMKPDDYPFVQRTMNEIAASFQYRASEATTLTTNFPDPHDYTNWGAYLFVGLFILAAIFIVRYLFKRKAY